MDTLKIDKIMEIAFRIISGIIAVVVIVGFVVSCSRPLIASANDELLWLTEVFAFERQFREGLIDVNRDVVQDVQDSNLTDSQKQDILKVLAVQELMLRSMPDVYGNPTEPILPESDTVTFSGSGCSGVYKSYKDNEIHTVFYMSPSTVVDSPPFSVSMFASDEFNVELHAVSPNWDWRVTPYYYPQQYRYGVNIQVDMYQGMYARPEYNVSDSMGYFNTYTMQSTNLSYSEPKFMCIYGNSIPNLSANTIVDAMRYNSNDRIGGYGGYVEIPTASVDTQQPWNYYNNILIPYMRTTYPNVTENYYVFPNGYQPAPTPEPTEPPTFPNGGIYIDKQYNIGINIIYPTDASGQPITDNQGETVTETAYITDTSPLDGEYNFQMPTLAHINVYDATLPNPDLSDYSDGISFIWTACYNILTETGFMPVVMICFALGLFGFILWKLGG